MTPQEAEGINSARMFAKGYMPNPQAPATKNYADYTQWYQEQYPKSHGGQAAPAPVSNPEWGGKSFAEFTPQEKINWWLWKIPPGMAGVPTTREELSDETIDTLDYSQLSFYLRTGKDPRKATPEQIKTTLDKFAYHPGVAGTGQAALYYYNQPGVWDALPTNARPQVTQATSQNLAIEPGLSDLLPQYDSPDKYWKGVDTMLAAREAKANPQRQIYYSPDWDFGGQPPPPTWKPIGGTPEPTPITTPTPSATPAANALSVAASQTPITTTPTAVASTTQPTIQLPNYSLSNTPVSPSIRAGGTLPGANLPSASSAGAGTTFSPRPSSAALGAFSQMPKGGPPVMGGGDWYSVGQWTTPPTGQTLLDWNAWLKRIGVPENTFSQFSMNPKTGQYAIRNTYDPTKDWNKMTYSDFARNNLFQPMQQLTPPPSTNAPINATPTVTRSTITLPSTTTPFPQYNAPTTAKFMPQTMQLMKAYQQTGFPTYNSPATSPFRKRTSPF